MRRFINVMVIHYVGESDFIMFLPLFRKEIEVGNMPTYGYASWHDRFQLLAKKKQLYGEYSKKYTCVKDLDKTNFERKKIGLPRLKENKCN